MLIITIILLFIALSVLAFFHNIILAVLSAFFGLFKRNRKESCNTENSNSSGSSRPNATTMHSTSYRKKRKVFDSSDGEYVDFEEVEQ